MKRCSHDFVDFQNFAQGFGFADREAISEAMEFSETLWVGFGQGCDIGVAVVNTNIQRHKCPHYLI